MIPQEITHALERGRFNLLIKGAPGTGKTSLALTIVKSNITKAIYISTRTNLLELQSQFPWINTLIEKELIYDATISRFPRKESKYKIQYSNISEFIKSIYELVEKFEGKNVTLIIDSINALKEYFDVPEDTIQIEKAIIEISDLYNFNTIFISESMHDEKLDYLVDGIILMDMKFIDDLILRKLIIKKIRGAKISIPTYYFTITNKGVELINPARSFRDVYSGFKPLKISGNIYSTGIKDLDDALGGGIYRSFSVFCEVDSVVPQIYSMYLLDSLGLNMMYNGIPWYFMSSLSLSQYYLYRKFKEELTVDVDKLFRLITIIKTEAEYEREKIEFPAGTIFIESDNSQWETLYNALLADIKKNNFNEFYVSVALNPLASFYSIAEFTRIILTISKLVSAYNSAGVFFTTSKIDNLDQLRGIFDYYLKIEKYGNTVMLRILKPFVSAFYGVELYEKKNQGLQIRLKKIN